ncbi:DUF2798 domain-containing protein [Amphritea sp. 1_MG-2023]|uniref:DUF2798 domain-containing protein n=1 Tax=Amphritea sp. 1_MG-2023 TaxID=3062670 RepID=UPI0026E1D4FA|nr:DUF2798 domain-containing protein [Amphritea sp. 1_MG-2023]MDO6561797.1 DUF2798 domain-containing protein [Amphritea sp. 1_MG-2023]
MSVHTDSISKTPLIYKALVVVSIMSVMGGSLTGVMTYMNVGYANTFYSDWLSSFLAALILMPVGFLLMGLITKLVALWLPNANAHARNLVTGGMMACIMESMMAFSTTANTLGFSNFADFLTGWSFSFLAALPLGLTLMMVISLTVKPKIELYLKS